MKMFKGLITFYLTISKLENFENTLFYKKEKIDFTKIINIPKNLGLFFLRGRSLHGI